MTQHVPEPDRPAPSPRVAASVVAGFTALAVGVSLVGGGLLNPAASTTDGDYAGETVEMMIPLAEGGGTDTWARFVATELTHEVPGSPGLAPVNDDGGEGILGTNHFMSSARSDGTEVLVSTASTVVPYLLDMPSVRYDFSDLRPILANGTGAVVYARTGAGVKGPADLVDRDRPLVFGGIAATSLDLTTLLAFDLLGADVKATFGFEGRGPVNLALQRGEVIVSNGAAAANALGLTTQVPVRSVSRSGVRRTSRRMRSCSARVYRFGWPPPWPGVSAASPARLKRATNCATASPLRRPAARAASV